VCKGIKNRQEKGGCYQRLTSCASVFIGQVGVKAYHFITQPLVNFCDAALQWCQLVANENARCFFNITEPAPSEKTERQPQVIKYEISAPIHIVAQPGQSAQDIAREVARQLDERERRARAKTRSNFSDRGGYE